ncbi:MAG: hypothetical protein PHR28_03140 [candidate division Zixibacteria bacterium]|jgi:hypothetical protein|nr:hypothetical protein [candidate division Zixibacteria bacterium]
MSDILKFEIVSMDDECTKIVFKSPDDLIKFYENVVHGGKDAVLISVDDTKRRSKLVRNDNLSNRISDNRTELTSEEYL